MPAYEGLKGYVTQSKLLEVPANVSRQYCEYMTSGFSTSVRNHQKAIGQFLTPMPIADSMTQECTKIANFENSRSLRVIDPFCGDGRLLVALLRALASLDDAPDKVDVVGWDIDSQIIGTANKAVRDISKDLPFQVDVRIERKDAFNCASSLFATFDVCVTNPPWSSTKSLKEKAFESHVEYEQYQDVANAYGRLLVERFPEVKGGRSFGAGALNLSRFGIALSLRLLKETGICGIVMPSSFTADTTSSTLRMSIFQHFNLHCLHYYPAELKLISGADQAAVYMILSTCGLSQAAVVSHLLDREVVYELDKPFWDYSSRYGWLVPLGYSDDEMKLIEKLSYLPTLDTFKSIKLGREVDETRIAERLCDQSPYRFVKGFMITCYRLSDSYRWYYDSAKSPVPQSASGEKVVWRDVSRVSQRKRVQATLLGPNHVAGNSLGIATCEDSHLLRAFLGVLNSSVFEFMARTVLTTNHVSAGMLKRLPFPEMSDEGVKRLSASVNDVLGNPYDVAALELVDKLVADAYGLTTEELEIARRSIKSSSQLTMEI